MDFSQSTERIIDALVRSGTYNNSVLEDWVHIDFEELKIDLSRHSSISFNDVKFEKGLVFRNFYSEEIQSIEFVNCTFKERLFIENVKTKGARLEFNGCSIECSKTWVVNSVFETINVYHQQANTFQLDGVTASDFYLSDSTIKTLLSFHLCQFEVADVRSEVGGINKLSIDSEGIKEFYLGARKKINSIYLKAFDKIELQGVFGEIALAAENFKLFNLTDLLLKDEEHNYVDKLQVTDVSFQGIINVSEASIYKLNFDNISSTSGSIRLNEVKITEPVFIDCSINSFYWNQVHFYNPPEITRCDLGKLKMANVIWQEGKKLKDSFLDKKIPWFYWLRRQWLSKNEKHFESDDISELRYERDTYRQLKAASIFNSNNIEALEFYRLEMRLFWKEIRVASGIPWYDRFSVFAYRWTSDFGQNWVMPLFWLLVVTFFYYYAWEKPEFGCGWNNFKNGFFDMISYLNPFKLKGNSVDNIDKVAIGKDFLFKALAGYFIYHFLKASRKFGRV